MVDVSIDDYYDYERMTATLEDLVGASNELLSMTSIGETPENRQIWCVTAGKDRPGRPIDRRPALLVTANLHARELAGTWVCLSLLHHLVEGYGSDPDVTRLLDEQAFYVIPRIAADGAEHSLRTRQKIRSRHVSLAEDDVGRNEVLPGDLTGDGRILTMRWPSAAGEKKAADDDDRVLLSRASEDSDGEFYRATVEGTIPHYDGGEVDEPKTRCDFNRNFPTEQWRPFQWIGHGKYPLSEPETRAVGEFVYDHPNITGVADLHTGPASIFYPVALADPDPASRADADLVERIGTRGEEITGFPYLISWNELRGTEPPLDHPGWLKDFAYDRAGVPGYVVEHGVFHNYLGLESTDLSMPPDEHERERYRRLIEWHDEHPERGLFHEWEPVDHPQLGEVEVGGWDPVVMQNPPTEEMDGVAERTIAFLLEFAGWAPRVRLATPEIRHLDADLYEITTTVENRGSLPTNLTEQGLETVQDARPCVTLRGDVDVISGPPRIELDHLEARTGRQTLEWVVRAADDECMEIEVTSPRGVFHTVEIAPRESR